MDETIRQDALLNNSQLEMRKNGLGGSDIATILGLNPYKTSYQLYLEKTENIIDDTISLKESVVWGNLLEEPIAQRYADLTHKEIRTSETIIHPLFPYFLANPDRLIVGEKKGLEIKTVGSRSAHLWGESGSKIIPEYYYPQIMHYLFVLDYDSWDVAALIGGQELRIYTFERDKEFDRIIEECGTEFWENNVLKRIPPELACMAENSVGFLKKIYKTVDQEITELDEKSLSWKEVYLDALEHVKKYQTMADGAKAHFLVKMRNASIAKLPDGSSFVRKMVKVKGYSVPPSEYVNFSYRKGSHNERNSNS